MFAKILRLFVILAILYAIIDASVLKEVKIKEDYEKFKVEEQERNLKIKRCTHRETQDTAEPESTTKQTPELHRVTLTRTQPVRFQHYQTENENTRHRRNVNDHQDTKNVEKTLKVNHINYKNRNSKNGLYKSSIDKYADGYNDGTKYRMKRYAVTENLTSDRTDYYAQRKAVMDRFHARQKEIAEKYAKNTVTTTPKYIKYDAGMTIDLPIVKNEVNNIDEQKYIVDHIDNNETPKFLRHDMDAKNSKGKTPGFSTKRTNSTYTKKTINDSYDSNTHTRKSAKKAKPTTKTNNDIQVRQLESVENSAEENIYEHDIIAYGSSNAVSYASPDDNNNKSLSRVYSQSGNCWKLIYQQNFIIGVYNASQADVDILTSIEGLFCITCVKIEPLKKTKAEIRLSTVRNADSTLSEMKLHIKGTENEELSYSVKVYAVKRVNNGCDHYY